MSANESSAILINGVSFWYRKNALVLDDITLDIKPAARIAIIGKNGSGKTTLIETILGLNTPCKGGVIFDKGLSKSIGCVFQDVDFDSDASLSKIFFFFNKLSKNHLPNLSRTELLQIFSKYELVDKIDKRFSCLSGGQKQKFKLLLCLELKPKVLLLDELTTSLDFEWRKKIVELIERYLSVNKDTILVLVSHNRDEIEKLTNEWYILENKKLIMVSSLATYFGN